MSGQRFFIDFLASYLPDTSSPSKPSSPLSYLGVKFTFSVADGSGASDSATLRINVVSPLAAPTGLNALPVGSKRIDLTWTDNSTGETGFKIERSTNGTKFSQVATVGAGATGYSNTGLRGGGPKILLPRARV
jgi:hypothetical protein